MSQPGRKAQKMWSLLEVEWLDSTVEGAWRTPEDYRRTTGLSICRTIGYLVKRDRVSMTLVQSLSDTGNVSDSMTIPLACITRVKKMTTKPVPELVRKG